MKWFESHFNWAIFPLTQHQVANQQKKLLLVFDMNFAQRVKALNSSLPHLAIFDLLQKVLASKASLFRPLSQRQ